MLRACSLLVLALATGCASTAATGPRAPDGWSRVVGFVDASVSSVPLLTIQPQPVRAGQTVRVTVPTYGSSSCTRADGTDVRVQDLVVDITPYDYVAPPGSPCTRDLRSFPHEASLRFPRAGEAEVRVHGRGAGGRATVASVRVTVLP